MIDKVDAATRRVLSRFGAFVRRTARQSIRKRKKASKPGNPPSSHTGLLKQFIFFAYEPNRRSVIIGPEKLIGRVARKALPALEYGGESETWNLHWKTIGGQRRRVRTYEKINIKARPFMRPAFAKEEPQMPHLWRDSVRP